MRISLWLVTSLLLFTLAVSPGPSIAGKDPDRFQILSRFSQVLELVGEQYVKPISREELIDDALKGMLEQLDPHSTYLNPTEFSGMQESTSGEFSGIGIEISMEENNRLTVVTPIEDTPAYEAGLQAGDHILKIDGTPTYDMTLNDAVKMIRGEKGSTVVLTILHEEASEAEDIPIVRGTIPIVSVKTTALEGNVLLVRMTRFNENTTRMLREGIDEYRAKNELKGVILDLRNNPGGVLSQAVSVADTFIEDGLIVYVQGRNEADRQDYFATRNAHDVSVPLVTMINSGSASAAEIVAGALQDHNRSLIIGERSFGKGSVQSLYPLSGGAGIKLTTALYYTPDGRSIQATGIDPDLTIPFQAPAMKDDGKRPEFFREKDLSGHLENANGDNGEERTISEKTQKMLKRDNQLRMALELVKKLPKLRSIK